MKINFPLPTQQGNQNINNPLNDLEAFCKRFNSSYEGHFFVTIITSSELLDNSTAIISYAFWIDFIKVKDYSYRLFEEKPAKIDGGYPLIITAFHGPPEEFGKAESADQLEEKINAILNSTRGKFII